MGTEDATSRLKANQYSRDWYARNKEALGRKRAIAGPKTRSPAQWEWHLQKLYGITSDAFVALFDATGGSCAICGASLFDGCHVDHCHSTGKVRGLLCPSCNHGLGRFNDSPGLLRQAALYLEG